MLKELARELALLWPPKSPEVDALFAIGDEWQPFNWDGATHEQQEAVDKLNQAGLVEQRQYWTYSDDYGQPVLRAVVRGHGRHWSGGPGRRVESHVRRLHSGHLTFESSKVVEMRRTIAGQQIVRRERPQNINMLHEDQPAIWTIESEHVCISKPSGSATSIVAASASVGDVNVTVNPQIIINQPAPVVSVQVLSQPPASLDNDNSPTATVRNTVEPLADLTSENSLRGKNPPMVLALLLKSHGFSGIDQALDNVTPLQVTDIAAELRISRGSVSRALDMLFPEADGKKGHKRYVALCNAGKGTLLAALTTVDRS